MTISNKYFKRSRISESKFRQLLRLFCLDIDAQTIAKITGLNRNTVNHYLRLIRKRSVELCDRSSPFSGEVEVDESYFGARRIKGKRGRIRHGHNEFADGKNHINGIESFWSYAKRRLEKFHGIPKITFKLHLKECEFRFNYRDKNIYIILLKDLKKYPLN